MANRSITKVELLRAIAASQLTKKPIIGFIPIDTEYIKELLRFRHKKWVVSVEDKDKGTAHHELTDKGMIQLFKSNEDFTFKIDKEIDDFVDSI